MITHMNTTITNPRIDYGQLAAKLNYAALDQKLGQLREQEPPKKRKQIGDVLAPVAARLRELRAKGWTYEQLAKELNDFGLPVKPSALRDYLTEKKPKAMCRRRHRGTSVAMK
jgi:ribosome-binding protein aMBF1 (putative translation factor)